jgi:transcriptional regulator with XRE-family HTH domain
MHSAVHVGDGGEAPVDHDDQVAQPGDGRATGSASDPSVDDAAYQSRLGSRLRAVRRAQGMRLQDVEERSAGRFKAVVVGSYERGDRAVSAHKLAALAAFYGVPVGELLPEDDWPRTTGREPGGVRIAVELLRGREDDPQLAPLLRLVQHVQWLRGDYNGRVLSLRGDDLRTVAIALGIDPDELAGWLETRGLLSS